MVFRLTFEGTKFLRFPALYSLFLSLGPVQNVQLPFQPSNRTGTLSIIIILDTNFARFSLERFPFSVGLKIAPHLGFWLILRVVSSQIEKITFFGPPSNRNLGEALLGDAFCFLNIGVAFFKCGFHFEPSLWNSVSCSKIWWSQAPLPPPKKKWGSDWFLKAQIFCTLLHSNLFFFFERRSLPKHPTTIPNFQ